MRAVAQPLVDWTVLKSSVRVVHGMRFKLEYFVKVNKM